jgi:hypothetical protein
MYLFVLSTEKNNCHCSSKRKRSVSYCAPYWDIGRVEFISEEDFFNENLGVKLEMVLREYDLNREGDQREPGWWIQQLIKLGASQIEDITENYVVWDGKPSVFGFFFFLVLFNRRSDCNQKVETL